MKCKLASRHQVALTAAGLATLAAIGTIGPADAASRRDAKRNELAQSQPGAPLVAVVSLNQQRITVYNAEGKMLQSPVSTGSTTFETPVGVYSVVQKKEVHTSNVYEDGNMPFMQRITWTGIALHAGALPGYPASHGCVRLPLPFAQRIFGLTDIGFRVIVVRDDILPGEIEHPTLFKPNPVRKEAALVPAPSDRASGVRSDTVSSPGNSASSKYLEDVKARASILSAEADAATKKATAVRQAAARKAAEVLPAARLVQASEANLARAQAQLKALEKQLETANAATTPNAAEAVSKLESAKEKAVAAIADAQAKLETAKTQTQSRTEAAERAADEAKAAEAARDLAVDAAAEASRKTFPVSIFVSRKTQRLYVRQGYHPIFEGPIAIRDPDKPLGSYVFTAMQHVDNGANVRWGVVSMYAGNKPGAPAAEDANSRRRPEPPRGVEGLRADVAGAKAALDRIEIPREVVERFADVVLPGSSLIVSDEGASLETGKDTDFVVLMSGEPQGGIKTRRREPRNRDDDDWGGGGRRGGGGFFSLFN